MQCFEQEKGASALHLAAQDRQVEQVLELVNIHQCEVDAQTVSIS